LNRRFKRYNRYSKQQLNKKPPSKPKNCPNKKRKVFPYFVK
jgi:hypothetical protein